MSAIVPRESSKNTLQNLLAKYKYGDTPVYKSFCSFEGDSRIRWVATVTVGERTFHSSLFTNRKVEAEESAANCAICAIITDQTIANVPVGSGRINRRSIDAKLGYAIKSIYLLKVIFYHKSLGPMCSEFADQDSKLAYLGDGILKWILCDYNYPQGITAAENSIISAQVSSRKNCAEMFRNLGLESELQVSDELMRMREKQGLGVALLGEKFETLIGAIYLDSKKSPSIVGMVLERAGFFKFGNGVTSLPTAKDFSLPAMDSSNNSNIITIKPEPVQLIDFSPYSSEDKDFVVEGLKPKIPPPYSYKARSKPKVDHHLTLPSRSDVKLENSTSEDELSKIQRYLLEKKIISGDDVISHSNCDGQLNNVEKTSDDFI